MSIRDKNKRMYIECDCGCGILELERWYWNDIDQDNCIDLTYYVRGTDTRWFTSLGKRIEHAWKMLIGKDVFIWNICIEDKDLDKLKEFVSSI